jgi:hypothetical protein
MIVTGCFETIYEVWRTPVICNEKPLTVWQDTSTGELRHYKSFKDKQIAEEVRDAFKYAHCKSEIRVNYKPVEEIPLIEEKHEDIK